MTLDRHISVPIRLSPIFSAAEPRLSAGATWSATSARCWRASSTSTTSLSASACPSSKTSTVSTSPQRPSCCQCSVPWCLQLSCSSSVSHRWVSVCWVSKRRCVRNWWVTNHIASVFDSCCTKGFLAANHLSVQDACTLKILCAGVKQCTKNLFKNSNKKLFKKHREKGWNIWLGSITKDTASFSQSKCKILPTGKILIGTVSGYASSGVYIPCTDSQATLPGESYCRQLGSLLLCQRGIFFKC